MLSFINPVYAKTDEELLLELAKSLKKKRIDHNLTQQQLADAVGITKDHLSKIERSGKTSVKTLVAISRKFDLLQSLIAVYESPELTPMQQYEIEQKTAKIKTERKRVKK